MFTRGISLPDGLVHKTAPSRVGYSTKMATLSVSALTTATVLAIPTADESRTLPKTTDRCPQAGISTTSVRCRESNPESTVTMLESWGGQHA